MPPATTTTTATIMAPQPAPISLHHRHAGGGGGSSSNARRLAPAAQRKLNFGPPSAPPAASPSTPPARSSSSSSKKSRNGSGSSRLPAVMRVSDCHPGTPRTIGGWEEAAICLVLLLLCAPVTWSFSLDFIFLGLGRQDLHIGIWSFFILYWILLGLRLIPRFRKPVRWLLDGWFLKAICRYFDATVIFEDRAAIEPGKAYIVTQCPHSTYPVAVFCSAFFSAFAFPGQEAYCMVASAMQLIPVFWQYLEAMGTRPISPEAIKDFGERGCIMNIVVGGIAEMFLLDDEKEQVLLRRGFIREAMKNGIDIIPTYVFNHTRCWRNALPGWLHRPLATFCRKTGLPFACFTGRFNFFIPNKVPLSSVVGRPIRVPQRDNPTEEEVEALLEEYKAALLRLYYRYRPEGETRELVLLEKYPWHKTKEEEAFDDK